MSRIAEEATGPARRADASGITSTSGGGSDNMDRAVHTDSLPSLSRWRGSSSPTSRDTPSG